MSRIGKKPVAVPAGVTAAVDGNLVKVKGAKGELTFMVPEDVSVALENGAIAVTDEYTRRPGFDTREISRMTGSPSKYFSSISNSERPLPYSVVE